nr:alanine racemase [Actinomycetota bacterium]
MTRTVPDLPTPALVVDLAAFDRNVATMAARWPGTTLRPHVKAFKSTALARRLAANGHTGFCCATVREMEGMAAAGLGDDLLLANEVLGPAAERLGALARSGTARVTTGVDSVETVEAAAGAGVMEVLIDVNVGLPRCGCDPADAGRLADLARSKGMTVRGVMA